jgi:3-oxoadipate enol-lactonase
MLLARMEKRPMQRLPGTLAAPASVRSPSIDGAAFMKLVTTEDAQLRCEHSPRPGAPALLLLNPLGTSLEIWDDPLAELSERYEVVRYDVRGHGESTSGSKTELSMEQLARDALAVLDSCGIARAHLCGLSIGGMTAMQIATLWPDRVLKIALCSTSPYMAGQTNWNERIQTVRTQGVAPLIDGILQRWLTTPYRMAHPETVERIRAMLLKADPQGYAACAAAIRDMDQRESIKTITAKTLVIGGTQDPGTTPADHALIAASIPGAQLVMLEAAHLLQIERQQEFTETLLQFLAA